ncbi:MAG: hypothetical protein ACOVQA_02955, partial [Thermoflexibacteraceae bacterium]
MDINKHIIDQRITKIVAENPLWFQEIDQYNKSPEEAKRKKQSKAFLCLAVATYLGIELTEAETLLTEGGNDAGIDAIYIGDFNDYDFPVTLFQSKYVFDLEKESNFPANSVQKVVGAIGAIFDPSKQVLMNDSLSPKVEEIRSLIADGYMPIIKVVFINNGLSWNQEGDNYIKGANYPKEQVQFEHFNHKDIVQSLQTNKNIDASIKFSGKSF